MMITNNYTHLELIIVTLFEKKAVITLRDIASTAGLSSKSPSDRRAIQRALIRLIQSNVIEAQNSARARTYRKLIPAENKNEFNNIQLSPASAKLLQIISQPISARKPVGYNQDFLKSYTPNKTFYLHGTIREKLFAIGNAEPQPLPRTHNPT